MLPRVIPAQRSGVEEQTDGDSMAIYRTMMTAASDFLVEP